MGSLRAVAFASVLVPAVVHAQPTAKEKAKASELVKQAIAKSQGGDHDTAVQLYEDAYKIIPQPLLLSNIGSEYQALQKPVEALKYFCKYLEADPNGSNVSFATAQAKTLYIELGGIQDVKDEDVCKPIVKPPPEKVEAVEPPPPPPPEKPVTPEPPPARSSSTLRWVGVGVGAVGLAAFGTGVYFGMQAKDISDQITNHDPMKPWPANIGQLEKDGASYEKKQIGFMIGGGLAVAAGVVMFVVGGPKSHDENPGAVTIAPVATPDTLGFAAAGRF